MLAQNRGQKCKAALPESSVEAASSDAPSCRDRIEVCIRTPPLVHAAWELLSSSLIAHLKLLFRLWWQPAAAMGEILDRGSLLFASLAAIGVALLLQAGPIRFPFSFYTPLLVLAAVYVPGVLLIAVPIARLGALGTVFQRDYSPLLTCAAMAWSAAQITLVLAVWTAPATVFPVLAAAACLYFAVLMFFAVRTVFGTENGVAAGIVCLSWIPLVAAFFLAGPLSMVLRLIASPFFLLFAFYYLRSEFSNLGQGLRSRQNFHRMMEAAGRESARWRSAVSARTHLPAAPPVHRGHSPLPAGCDHRPRPKPMHTSSWAASRMSRAASRTRWRISRPCCSRTTSTV